MTTQDTNKLRDIAANAHNETQSLQEDIDAYIKLKESNEATEENIEEVAMHCITVAMIMESIVLFMKNEVEARYSNEI